jgi:hypothetical protein
MMIALSVLGTRPTRFGAATRLSLIWGLPDAPDVFLGAARDDGIGLGTGIDPELAS